VKNPLKIYVACALTYVPNERKIFFTLLLNDVKRELRGKGYEVMDFLSAIKKNPEPKEVYSYDIGCLKVADCMLALGDYPGTGLGYEICYTTELRKIPTMVGVMDSDNISKLLKGVSHKYYKFTVFSTPQELVESFIHFVNSFYEKSN
jgi:hypothetical protein